jgi:hypothetical protein
VTATAWRSPLDAAELREVLDCLKRRWQPLELAPVFETLDLVLGERTPPPAEVPLLTDRIWGPLAALIGIVHGDEDHAHDPGVEPLVVRGRLLLAEAAQENEPTLGLLRRLAWTVFDLLDHMIEHRYLLDID